MPTYTYDLKLGLSGERGVFSGTYTDGADKVPLGVNQSTLSASGIQLSYHLARKTGQRHMWNAAHMKGPVKLVSGDKEKDVTLEMIKHGYFVSDGDTQLAKGGNFLQVLQDAAAAAGLDPENLAPEFGDFTVEVEMWPWGGAAPAIVNHSGPNVPEEAAPAEAEEESEEDAGGGAAGLFDDDDDDW